MAQYSQNLQKKINQIISLEKQCLAKCNHQFHRRVKGNYILDVQACWWDFDSLKVLCGKDLNQKQQPCHFFSQYQRHDISQNSGPIINGHCYYPDIKLEQPCINCFKIYSTYRERINTIKEELKKIIDAL